MLPIIVATNQSATDVGDFGRVAPPLLGGGVDSDYNGIDYVVIHHYVSIFEILDRVRDNANFLRIYAEILTGT